MSLSKGALSGSRADASSPQAVSTEGFDPAREDNGCPYELTNERSIERAMAWHEGYRAALRWMMETTQ